MAGISDDAAARLAHLTVAEFSRESARWSGAAGAIDERGGILCYATGTWLPVLCNGVFRLDDRVPGTEVVERAVAWFGARKTGFNVWVHAGQDDDLEAAALAAGLEEFDDSPNMICERRLEDRPAPAGIELRWITGVAEVADFIRVSTAAYATLGMPGDVVGDIVREPQLFLEPHVHTVVAYERDEAVGAAQLVLSHGIGGVYWVGALEAVRGRGVGEAVTRAVTNRAFDAGAAVVSLQASKMGEPIYRRMGYRELYRYKELVIFQ